MNPPNVIRINKRQDHTQSPAALVGHFSQFLDGTPTAATTGLRVIYEAAPSGRGLLMAKLETMSRLATGWDGYDAPAPSRAAVNLARAFIETLARFDVLPRRVTPSVVGGVGVTQKRHGRKVYVEFFNDGKIFALFSDGEDEPRTREVIPGYQSFRRLITEMREYLNG